MEGVFLINTGQTVQLNFVASLLPLPPFLGVIPPPIFFPPTNRDNIEVGL